MESPPKLLSDDDGIKDYGGEVASSYKEEGEGQEGEFRDPELDKYPKSIFMIMGNEFCERFSFYGLKALLPLYFRDFLGFENEDVGTVLIHAFIFFAYLNSVFGGFVADSFWGKYLTILVLSIVYCFGCTITAVTAIPGVTGEPGDAHWWGAALGLFFTAVGTGGVKSCVSSFVGDQFVKGQEKLLDSVFAMFYFFINLGSFVSTLLTPWLRTEFGYAVAFGVPAVLICVATIIFFIGSPLYRKIPPGTNLFYLFKGVIQEAYKGEEKAKKNGTYNSNIPFFDYAIGEKFSKKTCNDVAQTLSVMTVFIPLPVFWSLYEQHASRWVYQADQMDRDLFGYQVQTEQIQVINPVLILILIPVFNQGIYPFLEKRGIVLKPLEHRMVLGMCFAALAFVTSGLLDLVISTHDPNTVFFLWQIPQFFFLGCGEIMVSVTGLEFAYSQAPKSMKTIVMAGWLMTMAFGNLLVVVVAAMDFVPSDYGLQLMFFALLMLTFVLIFMWICTDFKYRDVFEEEIDPFDDSFEEAEIPFSRDDENIDVHLGEIPKTD